MTSKEIQPLYEQIVRSLDKKELKAAFDFLLQIVAQSRNYLFRDELFELQETYKQMLYYYVAGSKDPMQQKIYSELMASVYEITDLITQQIVSGESPELYYAIRRTLAMQPESISKTITSIHAAYVVQNLSLAETLTTRLFNAIWTSSFLSEDDMNRLQQSLSAGETTLESSGSSVTMTGVNCQLVSALTLGLQVFFDKRKMQLLIHAADSNDEEVKIRAYVGMLITLYRYKHRIDYYPDIKYRMDTLSESPAFKKNVYSVILRFILSKDTEKITTKLKDEIIPEIMKLYHKANSSSSSKELTPEFFEFEMNPEWIENFEKSPLGKKIEEFNRLQEEGADVMHFNFVHLKHFPFFNEISNWFLPFYEGVSFLSEENKVTRILQLMAKVGLMCNSDLYSFYFSIKTIREEGRGRQLPVEQLESQLLEWKEQKNADLHTRDDHMENIIGHYIQDLYRFYKLFPRRNEFRDIFVENLDFQSSSIIQRYFSDKNDLLNIADYYLRRNYFADALKIYHRLSDGFGENEMLFQKKGFCLQMTGDYEGALDDYTKAELINSESKWLLRRTAQCYRAVKKPEKALGYYLRLEKTDPDNLSVLLNIGSCHLDMKNYTEALNYYFKVDYLDHESGKGWRPIAWCSFLMGKYEQARNYYQKIIASNPTCQDYTNAGHTEWTLHKLHNAFDYYLKSIQSANSNFETFLKEFTKDIPELTAAGIEVAEIPFMLDQLRFSV